ncbi:MAG TPA: phosphoenolpyruvate-utilizing N-terminal domain-containing protein, partial [Accumulibacter sp.]|nr:phosphoenolpyruvate-utilizing N-terminal domain-containing protein [Accumulibacter sp.]
MSFTLHGLAVSAGIAIGRAHLMSHATLEVSHLVIAPRLVDKEVARFEAALQRVREEFAALKGRMKDTS